MASTWRENISMIRNGDDVNEQTVGLPVTQLAERTQYLKDRLDASAIGEGLILFSQAISSAVSADMAVYYDETDQQFKPALASTTDDVNGMLKLADSGYVIGVVARKLSAVAADILIRGRYKGLTVQDASGTDLPEGHYWLSAVDQGRLVSARPAAAVYVAQVTEDGLIVNPTPREVLEDHIHYKFDLLPEAAGTVICLESGRVDIVHGDSEREGWLEAADPIFGNTAPVGAYFGYNWTRNSLLAAVWPPQPLSGAHLDLNGTGVSPDHVLIDSNGIWWMTSCDSDVPWEQDTCISSSVSTPVASSSSGTTAPGRPAPCASIYRRLTLWFTRMVSKTAQASVTGIKAADGSPLVVSGCASPDAEGYCQSKVILDIELPWDRTGGQAGSQVVKNVTGYGNLLVGHMVEGIRGTGLAVVTGSQILAGGYSAGSVTINGLDPTQVSRKVDVGLVALSGASESIYQSVLPYVGLPSGRETSYIGRVRVPHVLMTQPRLQLDLWFATPTAGTPPAGVTIEYALINDTEFVGLSSSSGHPGSPFPTLPTSLSSAAQLDLEDAGAMDIGNYFAKLALDVPVSSNQLLMFRVTRSDSDSYAGELAVVNMVATIYDGA
jgi:hypothetical protein